MAEGLKRVLPEIVFVGGTLTSRTNDEPQRATDVLGPQIVFMHSGGSPGRK